jgi:hypothetical protein
MLDPPHLRLTASLKPKRCIRREIHAVIAQDGPELLLQIAITADAAVLDSAAMLCVLSQLHF